MQLATGSCAKLSLQLRGVARLRKVENKFIESDCFVVGDRTFAVSFELEENFNDDSTPEVVLRMKAGAPCTVTWGCEMVAGEFREESTICDDEEFTHPSDCRSWDMEAKVNDVLNAAAANGDLLEITVRMTVRPLPANAPTAAECVLADFETLFDAEDTR